MDLPLFEKYQKTLIQRRNKLEEIIMFIEEETGARLTEEEITLQKNTITFQTSSVKRVLLRNKKIQDYLKEKGYTSKF